MANNLVVPYTIFLKDKNASSVENFKVIAYNRTTKEKLTESFNSSSELGFDLANFVTAVEDGDVIELSMMSKYTAMTTHTVTKTGAALGGADVSWTSVASPSSLVAVSL